MMRDPPDTALLLMLADETMARPDATAGERRLAVRCRAIASREARDAAAAYDAIGATLARLYGAGDARALFRRLAADIRAGRFDEPGPERDQVERLLRDHAAQRLRENNPEF